MDAFLSGESNSSRARRVRQQIVQNQACLCACHVTQYCRQYQAHSYCELALADRVGGLGRAFQALPRSVQPNAPPATPASPSGGRPGQLPGRILQAASSCRDCRRVQLRKPVSFVATGKAFSRVSGAVSIMHGKPGVFANRPRKPGSLILPQSTFREQGTRLFTGRIPIFQRRQPVDFRCAVTSITMSHARHQKQLYTVGDRFCSQR